MSLEISAWRDAVAGLLRTPPTGMTPVVDDGHIKLVPEDLLREDPRGLTADQRDRVVVISPIGLAEEE